MILQTLHQPRPQRILKIQLRHLRPLGPLLLLSSHLLLPRRPIHLPLLLMLSMLLLPMLLYIKLLPLLLLDRKSVV